MQPAPTGPPQPDPPPGALDEALAGLTVGGQRLDLEETLEERPPGLRVARAVQRSLGRTVIVSRPAPDAPASVERDLRREARLLARLDHPNILPVHDVIDDEDGLAVITPDIPGRSWAERLASPHLVRAAFGADDLLAWHVRVLLRVCRAIEHAHEHGVIHRDLRPRSILVGDVGEVYVTRWDLACPSGAALPLTSEQVAVPGRAARLAPEMVLRSAGRVGPRTDVYQLGGLLYEVLTGAPPHAADDPEEAVRRVLFQDPALPHDAPPSLARVCKRALARNPAARHADVAAFRADLEAALAHRTAWALARDADQALERLRGLVRDPEARRDEILRTFGALRLGYERAAATAPDLQVARLRLERAGQILVRWQVERGDLEGARTVLASTGLDAPVDLAEALAPSTDPPPRDASDAWRRTWMTALLAMVWVPSPLMSVALPDGPATVPGMALGCLVMGMLAGIAGRTIDVGGRGSGHTRRLTAWATWGPCALALPLLIAWGLGLPADLARYLTVVGATLVVGTAAFSAQRALLGPMLAYGVATIATLAAPWAWAPAMVGAAIVLVGSLVGLRDPTEPDHER